MDKIPFQIDRAQRTNHADQIADGFARAIASGYYKAGERLPTVRELVSHFSVSSRDVVAAVASLTDRGLVESVPRRGLTVRNRRALPVWKGHVLCVVASGDFSYSILSAVGRLRERISKEGYLFTQVTVPRGARGALDCSGLDYALSQPMDFAVLMSGDRRLVSRLSRRKVPFVSEHFDGAESLQMCRGTFGYDLAAAFDAFAACCRERGVAHVRVVRKDEADARRVLQEIKSRGLSVESLSLRVKREGTSRLEALRRAGYDAVKGGMVGRNGHGQCQLLFTDDYVASGALMAIAEAGIRVPEDVRLATVVNVGNRPVTGLPYDAFVIDPFADGDRLAAAVIMHLKGERPCFHVSLPQTFEAVRE